MESSEIENSIEQKMAKYESFGNDLFVLVAKDQNIELGQEALERLKLTWRLSAWIDYKIDTGQFSREEITFAFSGKNSNILPSEYFKLKNLFPDAPSFSRFVERAKKAVSIIENVSIKNRHRESIYFAQVLVYSLCLTPDQEVKMLRVISKMSSAGNFIDDFLDMKVDNTNMWLNIQKLALFRKEFIRGLKRLNSPVKVLFEFAKLTRKARSITIKE